MADRFCNVIPRTYFMVAGSCDAGSSLNAFDGALLDAGIGDVNLVRMSSICPPHCSRVQPHQLPYGALVPVAYANHCSSTKGERISAAVAIAFPMDPQYPGLIMEHSGVGQLSQILDRVREMAIEGMQMRNREIREISLAGIEHVVARYGAAFAGVVLWD